MVGKVARAFGPSFEAVWHQRYDLTLLAYLTLLDLERLEGKVSKHQQLDTAVAIGLGVKGGPALSRIVDKFQDSLQRGPADEPEPNGGFEIKGPRPDRPANVIRNLPKSLKRPVS